VTLTREEPYQFLSVAASRRWIRFVAPHEHALGELIKKHCGWLQQIEVVHTSVFDDVAEHAAGMLVEMLQQHAGTKKAVHVGFAGGHAMRKLAQRFAAHLREPVAGLPETVVFHAMVPGFDVNDPSTDPNAFFTYFLDDLALQVKTAFYGLRTPALVEHEQFEEIKKLAGVKEAFDAAAQIDIVCTSGSSWRDPHSLLRYHMGRSEESLAVLKKAGCVGDMLWRPLGSRSPIATRTQMRAMTLMDLDDLQGFIRQGKQVLLALGPCNACGRPKTDVLKAILKIEPHLITHLVIDSLSARDLFRTE
jgi:DNA-binding transcriptional regulator LsrR (DeoR family)